MLLRYNMGLLLTSQKDVSIYITMQTYVCHVVFIK